MFQTRFGGKLGVAAKWTSGHQRVWGLNTQFKVVHWVHVWVNCLNLEILFSKFLGLKSPLLSRDWAKILNETNLHYTMLTYKVFFISVRGDKSIKENSSEVIKFKTIPQKRRF